MATGRKEIRKLELTFRALAPRRSESRNCGLCVAYIVYRKMELRYWVVPGNYLVLVGFYCILMQILQSDWLSYSCTTSYTSTVAAGRSRNAMFL